jgi:hypothetical protein
MIDNACAQRAFRSNNRQIGLLAVGNSQKLIWTCRIDRYRPGNPRDSGVSRGAQNLVYIPLGSQAGSQGMLPGPSTDYKNPHCFNNLSEATMGVGDES